MVVDCSRCGESFDEDRETDTPGQDTSRCPACGNKCAVDEEQNTDAAVTIDEDGDATHIHIHVHRG